MTGDVSGSSGSCTGNSATATILATARTIGGVSFDGSAAINLPGVNASGNQDTSGTAALASGLTGTPNISCGTGAFSGAVTLQDNLDLQDSDKILVGTGDDLEIYHNGSDTYFDNTGTGSVYLRVYGDNEDIYLQTDDGSGGVANYVVCDGGTGAVSLRHYGTSKLETAADGVDFSGTGSIKVPVGTTGQRPSGVAGDFRYNTTTGNFEGYTDAWGAIAGGGGGSETDTTVSSTSATSIYTTPHATNRSVSAVIQITQGTSYQVGRYLVIHNGTTATIIEESAVATGDMLGSFTADINGSNLRILANMSSASSATVTILPTVVTV